MSISDLLYIDESGITSPDFPTLLTRIKNQYKSVYGDDVYLEDDSQDWQWITLQTLALFETVQIAVGIGNSFSPATAQKDALTRNVKINGIFRSPAGYSQVDLVIIGQSGTVITNGKAQDNLSQVWNLPATVNIPVSGEITVTATAAKIGAITALENTITLIATPTKGWQTVNNPLAAVPGTPIEDDRDLRVRQTKSTMLPNQTVFDGIVGAVFDVTGVVKLRGYENDTALEDANGLPAYSISVVVKGGDAQQIANAIATKKPNGTPTFGNTSELYTDSRGVVKTIYFSRPTPVVVGVKIYITSHPGYLSSTGDAIKKAVSEYNNSLEIGDEVYISKLYVPANLDNKYLSDTFVITAIETNEDGGAFDATNVVIAYDEIIQTEITDVELVVT